MEESLQGRYFLKRKGYPPLAADDDPRVLAGEVYFNHWTRRLNPFDRLAEGDTVYLFDDKRRALAAELRVACLLRAPYDDLRDGMAKLRAVFGIIEPPGGWPGYEPRPGPGYLLAYSVDVISALDIPFDVRWDKLGGRHGYVALEAFASSDQVDQAMKSAVLDRLPPPGGPVLESSIPYDTGAIPTVDDLARAPRNPTPAIKPRSTEPLRG